MCLKWIEIQIWIGCALFSLFVCLYDCICLLVDLSSRFHLALIFQEWCRSTCPAGHRFSAATCLLFLSLTGKFGLFALTVLIVFNILFLNLPCPSIVAATHSLHRPHGVKKTACIYYDLDHTTSALNINSDIWSTTQIQTVAISHNPYVHLYKTWEDEWWWIDEMMNDGEFALFSACF